MCTFAANIRKDENYETEKKLHDETGSGIGAAGGCLYECKCGWSDIASWWFDCR